ncbi:Fructose-bisphosphate aldolase class II [Streptomyces malaysiensis]|uniref:Fructose-bisphosphate aldolase class II n=1 Tax=Streptomyces malaysiensis TaxID=92644 RepID=A0A7X5X1P6_STRMQ|nr:Fructose-bisphosphate aldolase class II [Streptomyces malaysiensis]
MPRSSAGSSAWVTAMWPNRLTSNTRRHSAIGRASTGAFTWTPALLTSACSARIVGDAGGERLHLLGLGDVEDDRLDAGRSDGVGVTVASHTGQGVESLASQFAGG